MIIPLLNQKLLNTYYVLGIHSDMLYYLATLGKLASRMSIKVISIFKMCKRMTHLEKAELLKMSRGQLKHKLNKENLLYYTLRKYETEQEK